MSGIQVQGLSPSGKDVPLAVTEEGHLIGGGSSGGSSLITAKDADGTQWIVEVNTSVEPSTFKYKNFITGVIGVPVGQLKIDGDTDSATEATLALVKANLGLKTEAPTAADGTGDYSLIQAVKRSLLNWAALLAKIPALGQALKAASIPVTLASDQTLPLPTGAATLALQKDGWQAVTITGRTRDAAKDMSMNYADGTSQTLYFTTAEEFAGQSARA